MGFRSNRTAPKVVTPIKRFQNIEVRVSATLPSKHCFERLRNDLYCVEWGVKLYSLTRVSCWRQTNVDSSLVSKYKVKRTIVVSIMTKVTLQTLNKSYREKKPEEVRFQTASENRQRWCGRDVARQVVPGAGCSGYRKSSVADSRQLCTTDR